MFPFPFSFFDTSAFEYTAIDNSFSMEFDGVASYYNADALSSGLTAQANGTVSMWWKPVDHTPPTSNCLFSIASTTVTNEYFAMYNLDNGKLYAQLKDNGFNYWVLQTDAIAFATNTWTHVAITHNGVKPELYINGSKPLQSFVSELDKARWWDDISIQKVNIGALIISSGTSGYSNGHIDEVAIWTSALSEETIQAIYDTTANNPGKVADLSETPEGTPAAWYRMGD